MPLNIIAVNKYTANLKKKCNVNFKNEIKIEKNFYPKLIVWEQYKKKI